MKTTILLSVLLMTLSSLAQENSPPGNKGKIVLQALFDGIGIKEEVAPVLPPTPDMTPTPEVKPTERPLSKGELAIKEQLEKNRQILAKQKEEDEKEKQISPPSKEGDFQDLRKQNRAWLAQMKKQNKETIQGWKKEVEATHALWKEKQKEFLKNLKHYKENLFNVQADRPLTKNELKLSGLTKKLTAEHYIIPGSLDLPIKDQGRRPTCAAFAGARSIETKFKEKGIEARASEQYIYWASKPACQSQPCNQKGSWTSIAFEKSRISPLPDIPLENDCPYRFDSIDGNETQIPLAPSCQQGKIKIVDFDYIKGLDETVEALKRNFPVIVGLELTPNFYENNGLVKEADAKIQGNLDGHAKGHAVLLVGFIKLPAELQASEGKACFVMANSWGEGYGRGGFSCLTERWILNHRIPNAFIALKDVSLNR